MLKNKSLAKVPLGFINAQQLFESGVMAYFEAAFV